MCAEKKYYDFVFVVLVYKNIQVLRDFFDKFDLPDTKVIVVNSHYSEESELECRAVAEAHNADFLNIPNRGYGGGNNVGCDYAAANYKFKYLVISNSDILIQTFEISDKDSCLSAVIAPEIRLTNGKKQNPNIPNASKIHYNLLKDGFLKADRWSLFLAHIYSRLTREITYFCMKILGRSHKKIFSAHGSFIIIGVDAFEKLVPIFDDEMFLYNEELYLAIKCRKLNIPIIFDRRIKILHLEGASTPSKRDFVMNESRKSFQVLHQKMPY